eukprot:833126-Pelagomonas_calceolata.AAC.12
MKKIETSRIQVLLILLVCIVNDYTIKPANKPLVNTILTRQKAKTLASKLQPTTSSNATSVAIFQGAL